MKPRRDLLGISVSAVTISLSLGHSRKKTQANRAGRPLRRLQQLTKARVWVNRRRTQPKMEPPR